MHHRSPHRGGLIEGSAPLSFQIGALSFVFSSTLLGGSGRLGGASHPGRPPGAQDHRFQALPGCLEVHRLRAMFVPKQNELSTLGHR